jgi:peptidoglycan/xylan/chitin deacetylase (PgdA/CDA1 family)
MVSITIDCEEWNSPLLRGRHDKENNNTSFSRKGNDVLLRLFRKHNIKATFFVTGFYAEREPEDVRKIVREGHEIACHGFEHNYRNRKFDLEQDIIRGKEVLEMISGKKVVGFRAPQVQYSKKLLEVLAKNGFKYDSSLHPAFLPGYYNNRKFPLKVHNPIKGVSIKEVPVAVMPKSRLPIVWMFMRNLGVWWTQNAVDKLERNGINANLYFHSWEFVKMKSKNVPFYFTRRTGMTFLKDLEKFIIVNKRKGRVFKMLKETI